MLLKHLRRCSLSDMGGTPSHALLQGQNVASSLASACSRTLPGRFACSNFLFRNGTRATYLECLYSSVHADFQAGWVM